MNTITELSKLDGRVYIHLATRDLAERFLRQAEEEGFTFRDGVKPTKRGATEVMAINPDHTINYVGAVGHSAYQCESAQINLLALIRVEYTIDTIGVAK